MPEGFKPKTERKYIASVLWMFFQPIRESISWGKREAAARLSLRRPFPDLSLRGKPKC